MPDVYTRKRKKYRPRSPISGGDADGERFAEWITGAFAEDYASKIADYCKAHKNCETCRFYNGVCRLNRYPWDWDVEKFENTP